MVGLRGVGKTVLLQKMSEEARAAGMQVVRLEAPEGRSLPALLAPQLRLALIELSRTAKAKKLAERGLRALAGFAKALKVKFGDIEVGLDLEPLRGLADNGDLDEDLPALFEAVGAVASAGETAIVLFVDELQYVPEEQLAVLISALHRCAQRQVPITMVGAGLPQLRGQTGKAKSYAERLFDFPEVGPLNNADARRAIEKPIHDEGERIEDVAVIRIIEETHGYPYFLQEWGKHAWEVAVSSPIVVRDVEVASRAAVAALDASFFRVRFDRLTPLEKRYLRAMADLGPGPHRSGDIAVRLGRKVTELAPTRSQLIGKGMIWSPAHGDTAFTVPLFDEFLKRTISGNDW
jgi:hypothetical protein